MLHMFHSRIGDVKTALGYPQRGSGHCLDRGGSGRARVGPLFFLGFRFTLPVIGGARAEKIWVIVLFLWGGDLESAEEHVTLTHPLISSPTEVPQTGHC
jgi:hypothetical protein